MDLSRAFNIVSFHRTNVLYLRVPVWSEICHVLTDILIYCSTQVLVCWRASASWWKWKYHRCQNSCSQSSWCKSTIFSSVENEAYIPLLWTVSVHPVPASVFVSCVRCGNVEEKVLLAAYFVSLTKPVIIYYVRSLNVHCPEGSCICSMSWRMWCEVQVLAQKVRNRVGFVVLH